MTNETIELIRPEQLHTINSAIYGTLKVGFTSGERLNVLQSFDHAHEKGGKLQTLGHALVTRVAFYADVKKHPQKYDTPQKQKAGLDKTDEYQRTSTVNLKFKNDGSFDVDAPYLCASVDLEGNTDYRKLVQAGYDANRAGNELIIPIKDASISKLIARARESGRVAPTLLENQLKLATAQTEGKSVYGQDRRVIALFGSAELAELNASYLSERGYKTGYVWDLTTKDLEKMLRDKEDHTFVRSVGLGGGGYYDVDYIDANDEFVGWARPVVHVGAQKSFIRNEGSVKSASNP